jgi:chemotaxis protein methyltransferase CheR
MSESEFDFELLKRKVLKARGFDCSQYRDSYLKRRISSRMRKCGVKSYRDYMRVLDKNPQEYDNFFDALAINVTQFFRNPETWEVVEKVVIPRLIAAKRERDSKIIRIWSVGCASGEEPYSIAILLREALGDDINDFLVSIYGTDIDEATLAEARRGEYKADRLSDVKKEYLDKYFTCENGKYKIKKEVKQHVKFIRHDLLSGKWYRYLDTIFCRNVVIYFSMDLHERLFINFYNALNGGGYFVMGKTEMLTGKAREMFECIDSKERIYRKPL